MVLAGQIENIEPPELWVKYDNGTEEPVAEKHHNLAKLNQPLPLCAVSFCKNYREEPDVVVGVIFIVANC